MCVSLSRWRAIPRSEFILLVDADPDGFVEQIQLPGRPVGHLTKLRMASAIETFVSVAARAAVESARALLNHSI